MLSPEYWKPDASASACFTCRKPFSLLLRRHHCRHCGYLFCSQCSSQRLWLRPFPVQQRQHRATSRNDSSNANRGRAVPRDGGVVAASDANNNDGNNNKNTFDEGEDEGSPSGISLSADAGQSAFSLGTASPSSLDVSSENRSQRTSNNNNNNNNNNNPSSNSHNNSSGGSAKVVGRLSVDVKFDLKQLMDAAASSRQHGQPQREKLEPHVLGNEEEKEATEEEAEDSRSSRVQNNRSTNADSQLNALDFSPSSLAREVSGGQPDHGPPLPVARGGHGSGTQSSNDSSSRSGKTNEEQQKSHDGGEDVDEADLSFASQRRDSRVSISRSGLLEEHAEGSHSVNPFNLSNNNNNNNSDEAGSSSGGGTGEEDKWAKLAERCQRSAEEEMWYKCRVCMLCFTALTEAIDRATDGNPSSHGASFNSGPDAHAHVGDQSMSRHRDPSFCGTSSAAADANRPNAATAAAAAAASDGVDTAVLAFARRHVSFVPPLSATQSTMFLAEADGDYFAENHFFPLQSPEVTQSPLWDDLQRAHTSPTYTHVAGGLLRARSATLTTNTALPLFQDPHPSPGTTTTGVRRSNGGGNSSSSRRNERGPSAGGKVSSPGGLNLSRSLSLGWQALKAQISGGGLTPSSQGGRPSSPQQQQQRTAEDDASMRYTYDSTASNTDFSRVASGSFSVSGEGQEASFHCLDGRSGSVVFTPTTATAPAIGGGSHRQQQQQQQQPASPAGTPRHAPSLLPARLTVRSAGAFQRLAAISRKERRICVILVDERGYLVPHHRPPIAASSAVLPSASPSNGRGGGGGGGTTCLTDMFLRPYLPACAAPGQNDQVSRLKDCLTLLALYEELDPAALVPSPSSLPSPHVHHASGSRASHSDGNNMSSSASHKVTPLPSPSLPPTQEPASSPTPTTAEPRATSSPPSARVSSNPSPMTAAAAASGAGNAYPMPHDRSRLLFRGAFAAVSALHTSLLTLDNQGQLVTLPAPPPGPVRRGLEVHLPVVLSPDWNRSSYSNPMAHAIGAHGGAGARGSPAGSPAVPSMPTATPSSANSPRCATLPSCTATPQGQRRTPVLSPALSPLRPPLQGSNSGHVGGVASSHPPSPCSSAAPLPSSHTPFPSTTNNPSSRGSAIGTGLARNPSATIAANSNGSNSNSNMANGPAGPQQPPVAHLRIPTQLIGLAVEVEATTSSATAGITTSMTTTAPTPATTVPANGGDGGGRSGVANVASQGPTHAAVALSAVPNGGGERGTGAVGSVSAAATQFVAATAVNNALTALGAQLPNVSIGVDAYVVVVLRQAVSKPTEPASARDSVLTPPSSPTTTAQTHIATSGPQPQPQPHQRASTRSSSPVAAAATVLPSTASEYPFSSQHLHTLFHLIANCGGAVPPVTILDVCQASDFPEYQSNHSGGNDSREPSPRGGATGASSAFEAALSDASIRMSPRTRSPLSRAKYSLRAAMQNLRTTAAAMRVNYVPAFYRASTNSPAHSPPAASGTAAASGHEHLESASPADNDHAQASRKGASRCDATAGAIAAAARCSPGSSTTTPQQPMLQGALEVALSSTLKRDYAASYAQS